MTTIAHGIRAGLLALSLAFGFAATTVLLDPTPAGAQQTGVAPRDGGGADSGRNPTADSVSEEALFKQSSKLKGIVSIPDRKAAMLEQPQGREWRRFHEDWMPWIGGLAVLAMLGALALVYMIFGPVEGHDEVSGEKIQRFNWLERFAHWLSASTFIVLAISGFNYILGKRLLQPLIGPDAFSAWSQWAKYAHDFLAWPFMLGITIMFLAWVRDNIPNRVDVEWLKRGGGLFGGGHVDAGRFNAGQKGVFWLVVLGGGLMSLTGIALLFPFSWADINGMQVAQGIHSLVGVLFVAAMLAHIYIGTLGMKGAYDAMGSGEVDLAWAKAHHNLWVEQEQARTASGPQLGSRPAPAE